MEHDFKFEEEPTRTIPNQARESGIIGMIISTGLAKNKKQATYILLGVIFVCIAILLFIYFSMNSTPPSSSPPVI